MFHSVGHVLQLERSEGLQGRFLELDYGQDHRHARAYQTHSGVHQRQHLHCSFDVWVKSPLSTNSHGHSFTMGRQQHPIRTIKACVPWLPQESP